LTHWPTQNYIAGMLFGSTSGWDNFMLILTKPDNIPILLMVFSVGFFTWLSLKEGLKNDKLIKEGRRDEILRRMQD
jgi:hypothetical protein